MFPPKLCLDVDFFCEDLNIRTKGSVDSLLAALAREMVNFDRQTEKEVLTVVKFR